MKLETMYDILDMLKHMSFIGLGLFVILGLIKQFENEERLKT